MKLRRTMDLKTEADILPRDAVAMEIEGYDIYLDPVEELQFKVAKLAEILGRLVAFLPPEQVIQVLPGWEVEVEKEE